jgi:hypothetical protein
MADVPRITADCHGGIFAAAEQDECLLRYSEPDFHRLSLQMARQKMALIKQALDMIANMQSQSNEALGDASQLESSTPIDEETLANLEYLLLRLQGILEVVIASKARKLLRDEAKKQQASHNSHAGGDKSCSEYSSGMRPPTTTWPWSIKPSLAVLWGVCWMFAMAGMYNNGNWNMNAVKGEQYAYAVGMTPSEYTSRADQELMSLAAHSANSQHQTMANVSSGQHHANGGPVMAADSSFRSGDVMAASWRAFDDSVSMANHLGGGVETGASASLSAVRSSQPIGVPGAALPPLSANQRRVLSSGHRGLQISHGAHHLSPLPPHPSGQISLSPQAASLDYHHHNSHHHSISAPTAPSASLSSSTHLSPAAAWPTSSLGKFSSSCRTQAASACQPPVTRMFTS